jgi:hypothetical protein
LLKNLALLRLNIGRIMNGMCYVRILKSSKK